MYLLSFLWQSLRHSFTTHIIEFEYNKILERYPPFTTDMDKNKLGDIAKKVVDNSKNAKRREKWQEA